MQVLAVASRRAGKQRARTNIAYRPPHWQMLNEGDQDRVNDRLTVCVTALAPWVCGRRYTKFTSLEDLKTALLASCCMTPLAGLPFVYRRELVFDGGLVQFQPLIDNREWVWVGFLVGFALLCFGLPCSVLFCSLLLCRLLKVQMVS